MVALAATMAETALVNTPHVGHEPGTSSGPPSARKMTYNEWRELRRRQQDLNKPPECLTRLQSLEVQEYYTIKLSVIVTGTPRPHVTWSLNDQILDEGDMFSFEVDEEENKYSVKIHTISKNEEGAYQLTAVNASGSDTTIGFITVKVQERSRKRSVSRRPLISTIMEWKSREGEEQAEDKDERITFHNRSCWDWWNLGKECICTSCVNEQHDPETAKRAGSEAPCHPSQLDKSRSRSLPDISAGRVVENKYQKLKTFWEALKK